MREALNCRLVTCLRQWVPKLKEGGFTDLVFEDPLEMLIDQLNSLGQSDSLTVASLEENFRDDMVSPDKYTYLQCMLIAPLYRAV